jgi:hypothetical protein
VLVVEIEAAAPRWAGDRAGGPPARERLWVALRGGGGRREW